MLGRRSYRCAKTVNLRTDESRLFLFDHTCQTKGRPRRPPFLDEVGNRLLGFAAVAPYEPIDAKANSWCSRTIAKKSSDRLRQPGRRGCRCDAHVVSDRRRIERQRCAKSARTMMNLATFIAEFAAAYAALHLAAWCVDLAIRR